MADLGELCKQFWEKTATRRDKLLQDQDLAENAVDIQRSEISQGGPTARWPDLEVCLERALMYRSRSRVETARRAGSISRDSDRLTDYLRRMAIADPGISTQEVLFGIRKNPVFGLDARNVTDPKISWDDDKGVTKTALVSGLKHRLSRVKKELRIKNRSK
jgi:hypothetical protein